MTIIITITISISISITITIRSSVLPRNPPEAEQRP
jgi:hypothetical protein